MLILLWVAIPGGGLAAGRRQAAGGGEEKGGVAKGGGRDEGREGGRGGSSRRLARRPAAGQPAALRLLLFVLCGRKRLQEEVELVAAIFVRVMLACRGGRAADNCFNKERVRSLLKQHDRNVCLRPRSIPTHKGHLLRRLPLSQPLRFSNSADSAALPRRARCGKRRAQNAQHKMAQHHVGCYLGWTAVRCSPPPCHRLPTATRLLRDFGETLRWNDTATGSSANLAARRQMLPTLALPDASSSLLPARSARTCLMPPLPVDAVFLP